MSKGLIQAFSPASTVTIAASTTSAHASLGTAGETVMVFNSTTGIAFVTFGTDSTVTATTANYPVPAGGRAVIDIGPITSTVAVILSTGTGSVYVSRGNGTAY